MPENCQRICHQGFIATGHADVAACRRYQPFWESPMTNETPLDSGANSAAEFQSENIEEECETTGDHHRMAAQHFSAAAKHHLLAAAADDDGDDELNARHAYLAYRHQ